MLHKYAQDDLTINLATKKGESADKKIKTFIEVLENIPNAEEPIIEGIFNNQILFIDNQINKNNYFIAKAITTLFDDSTIAFEDFIEQLSSSDININDILKSVSIIESIIQALNNYEANEYEIKFDSDKKQQVKIARESIIQYLNDNVGDIKEIIQQRLHDFITEDDTYTALEQLYNDMIQASNLDDFPRKEYTNEQIQEISNLTIDNLPNYFNSDKELQEVVESATSIPQLLLYENINKSYEKIAKQILKAIVISYINKYARIDDYLDFLKTLKSNIKLLQNDTFVAARRSIIKENQINGSGIQVDPIVEYVIEEYMNSSLPEEGLLNCNLRTTAIDYIDKVLVNASDQYLDGCIDYIINHSKSENNNFIDNYLNNIFQANPNIINKNIQKNSFASINSDKKKQDSIIELESENDNKEKDNNENDNKKEEKTNIKIDKTNPDTWDIKTFINEITSVIIVKIIDRVVNNDQLYFPTKNANRKDCLEKFKSKIRQDIIQIVRNDSKLFNSIINKEQLIKVINEQVSFLRDSYIINIRQEILQKFNDGIDPKIDTIISLLNKEIKNKLNTETDYLAVSRPLHSKVLKYILKNQNIINDINRAFIKKFHNTYSKEIINSEDIDNIYIKQFPNILIDDLYKKNYSHLISMFSKDNLDKVILSLLEYTDQLFLPKNDTYYVDFTQRLIQYLLSDLATVKKNTPNGEISEVFDKLYDRYDQVINNKYDGGDINTIANKIRETFFSKKTDVIDPLIINIIYKLFPDLNNTDFDTQSTLGNSLRKYIFQINRNIFIWKDLKSYIQKITQSVFHNNYNENNLTYLNKVFLSAIDSIQIDKNASYFKTIPLWEKSKEQDKRNQEREKNIKEKEKYIEETDIDKKEIDNNIDIDIDSDTDLLEQEKINISEWTFEQLNEYTDNKLQKIADEESSFIPNDLLSAFCIILIKNICTVLTRMNIITKQILQQRITEVVARFFTYNKLIKLRTKFLKQQKYIDDPFINNIYLNFPKLNKINKNSQLYKDIYQRINENLLLNAINDILNKYVIPADHKIYKEKFPYLFKEDKKDENNEKEINEKENNLEDDQKENIINNNDKKEKINKQEQKAYTIDNYTISELEALIHTYNQSFTIDNEIVKAAIGHIESFQGESYKRIFKPLFEGIFKKQLPTKEFAKNLLFKVQLTTLITNERNRFAEFCRIFLYNISNNTHKFLLNDIYSQRSIFTKQLRQYLLYNQNIINKINQRLYQAFEKYYNAYFNNQLNERTYNKSFADLSLANITVDSKGDVHQFKNTNNKEKIMLINNQVYIFNDNKSFIDHLNELNIQDSIYNYANGYIINSCVFLEPLKNCSEEEAVENLINYPLRQIKKVYLTINNDNNILTERRLAKLISKRFKI